MSIVVIIGPSGAGKSTVAKVLVETYSFHLQRTATTRPQRDQFDVSHTFIDDHIFDTMLASKAFFGTLNVYGYRYGLPLFDPKVPTILILRAVAVEELLAGFPDAVIVEIDAPLEFLEHRLQARDSSDRFDAEKITEEVALGKSLTTYQFDSSKESSEEIAEQIAMLAT